MKALLLGPNGQLGSDLVRLREKVAPEISILAMPRAGLDVANIAEIRHRLRDVQFDAMINCTGYHKTDEVEENSQLAFTVNAHAVRELALVCGERGARLFHVSTDYVFRGDSRQPYRETDPCGPLNVYGASKVMGESLAATSGADVTVLRVASLFGIAGASGKGGNFVETMIRLGREKGELRVVNDITMSPTATADVARAIFKLLLSSSPAGVYHVVNTGPATWFEFARAIIEDAGVAAKVLPISSREQQAVAQRPAFSALDNTKVRGVVGEVPHWRDALGRYLADKGHIVPSRG